MIENILGRDFLLGRSCVKYLRMALSATGIVITAFAILAIFVPILVGLLSPLLPYVLIAMGGLTLLTFAANAAVNLFCSRIAMRLENRDKRRQVVENIDKRGQVAKQRGPVAKRGSTKAKFFEKMINFAKRQMAGIKLRSFHLESATSISILIVMAAVLTVGICLLFTPLIVVNPVIVASLGAIFTLLSFISTFTLLGGNLQFLIGNAYYQANEYLSEDGRLINNGREFDLNRAIRNREEITPATYQDKLDGIDDSADHSHQSI